MLYKFSNCINRIFAHLLKIERNQKVITINMQPFEKFLRIGEIEFFFGGVNKEGEGIKLKAFNEA